MYLFVYHVENPFLRGECF